MEHNYFPIPDNIHEIININYSSKCNFVISLTAKHLFSYFYFTPKITTWEIGWIYIRMEKFINLKEFDFGKGFERVDVLKNAPDKVFREFFNHKFTLFTNLQCLKNRHVYLAGRSLDWRTLTNLTSVESYTSYGSFYEYPSTIKIFKGNINEKSRFCEKYSILENLNLVIYCDENKYIDIASHKILTQLILEKFGPSKLSMNNNSFENIQILCIYKINIKNNLLENMSKLTYLSMHSCDKITLGKNINNIIYLNIHDTTIEIQEPLTQLKNLIIRQHTSKYVSNDMIAKITKNSANVNITKAIY